MNTTQKLTSLATVLSLLTPGLALAKPRPRGALLGTDQALHPPQPTVAPVFPDEPFRAKVPEAGKPHALQQPVPQVFTLASGVKVLLIERRQLPTVAMELAFPGGSQDDPVGKEGLASVCNDLLTEGTKGLDKIAYSEALADLASTISSWAGVDQQGLSMATLARNLDKTLDLLADTLLQPGLREAEFQRLIKQRKAGLQAQRANPSALAARVANSIVYGPAHPHGRIATEASYDRLVIDDCRKYVAERIHPVGATLYVVGAIDRPTLEQKFASRLLNWQGKVPLPAPTGAPVPRAGRVFFLDVPGAQQAVVQVMHPGPKRTAADFDTTQVLASILSAGFSSRINMNIREKHGYAYGAGGGFSYTRDAGIFSVAASVRVDVAGPSVREIFNELKGIRAAEVTPIELSREKDGAILALPARWSTGRSVLSAFQGLDYYGLPLDYYARFVARVQAVDAAQILIAAKAYVRPDEAQVLVVGDAATVLPQIEALRTDGTLKGELVRLDADGKVIAAMPAPR